MVVPVSIVVLLLCCRLSCLIRCLVLSLVQVFWLLGIGFDNLEGTVQIVLLQLLGRFPGIPTLGGMSFLCLCTSRGTSKSILWCCLLCVLVYRVCLLYPRLLQVVVRLDSWVVLIVVLVLPF